MNDENNNNVVIIKYEYSQATKRAIAKYRQSEHGHEKIKQYSINYHAEHRDDPEYMEKKRHYSKLQHEKNKQKKEADPEYKKKIKDRSRQYYLNRKEKNKAQS